MELILQYLLQVLYGQCLGENQKPRERERGEMLLFKDLFYAGIGLATLTKEKAEETIKELVKRGEMSTDEGKDALQTMMIRMQEEKERFNQKVQEQVESIITSMNLVRKSDLDEVIQRLEEIEKRISYLEDEQQY